MSQIRQLNVPFVGGSAGDDLRFEQTTVFGSYIGHINQTATLLSLS